MLKSRLLPFVAALLLTAECATMRNASRRVVFEGGAESETKLAVTDLKLPSDWTPYSYLVLEMRASSPQRFFLTFYSSDGSQRRWRCCT